MVTVHGISAPLPPLTTPVATLGAFDGVHRGHQRILEATLHWAAELSGHPVALTFDPLPKAVLGPGGALCLTSLEHRLSLIGDMGFYLTIVVPFNVSVAMISADDFVRGIVVGWIGARHVVFGHDSTFGRRAEGNLSLLRRMEAHGILEVRSPAPVRHRGEVISSTTIRRAISNGDLESAEAMLGRPFSLLGTVVRGDGRGRTLGFPTANLDLHHEVVPPDGIYATLARLGRHTLPSLTYVGRRPTFASHDTDTAIEVHLIAFDGDIYGRDMEVQFVKRLREDRRFPSPDALAAQMRADREAALACMPLDIPPSPTRSHPHSPGTTG